MAGVKGQSGTKKRTSFKKGNDKHKRATQKGTRKQGRPPKPKNPTILQLIYEEIDKIIFSGACFNVLQKIIEDGSRPHAILKEKELAARYALEVLDRRLPKDQDQGRPVTIIIKNHVPYPGGGTPSEVVIENGGRSG